MKNSRFGIWAGILLLFSLAQHVLAQEEFPARPIKLVVGYAAGGSADFTARVVGQRMAQVLGRPVIVENRPGAAQNLAAASLAKSPADGYTLLLVGTSLAVNPGLYERLPFDLEHDFKAVGAVVSVPLLVVTRSNSTLLDLGGLVTEAHKKPGGLSYGSSGNGSLTHLSVERFKKQSNTSLVHIPYRGSAPMLTDLMAGQIDVAFDVMSSAYPQVKAGKLRALAVTSPRRSVVAPTVPTLDELGYAGLGLMSWYGILAPAGTPDKVISILNGALRQSLADPKVQEVLLASGSEPTPGTPQEFQKFFDSEILKWSAEARRLHLKLD